MIIVTTYDSPDIDGIACSIAYAALLTKQSKQAKAAYRGDLGLETEFVKQFTGAFPIEKHESEFEPETQFVLVDVSDPTAINPAIPLGQVVEVFDHRKLAYPEKFPNAQAHIELVGSCATLVTEQLQKANMQPDRTTAIYLYSAIISNTTNFLGPDTTQRDRDAAAWLRQCADIPDGYAQRMFEAKSRITAENIYDQLLQDLKTVEVKGKRIGVAQLEIANQERMISTLHDAFESALARIKEQEQLDYLMYDGIDVIKGISAFYTIDEASNGLFARALATPELKPHAVHLTKEIMLRKRILPTLDNAL